MISPQPLLPPLPHVAALMLPHRCRRCTAAAAAAAPRPLLPPLPPPLLPPPLLPPLLPPLPTIASGCHRYGWNSPGNPDPTGERLRLVKQTLRERTHIGGLFWE